MTAIPMGVITMLNLLKHELLSRITATIGWSIGLILFGALYITVFPEVSDQMGNLSDLAIYQAMGVDLQSFAGFISSVVLQFLPLLLGIYAIITSTQTLAGEEDNGTLEMIVAMPIRRWQIVLVKAFAIAVIVFIILVIAGFGNAQVLKVIKTTTEIDVTPTQLFAAVLNGWPITMAFSMIGLFLGAYLPHKRPAAAIATVIFVTSFFGRNLVDLVDSLENLKPFFLFTYLDTTPTIFKEGVNPADLWTLLGVAVVFLLLAILAFQRRNITVHAWPWQRAQVSDV
jgi:ABC-2 type transport system permease protein